MKPEVSCRCNMCGRLVPPRDLFDYGGMWYCRDCCRKADEWEQGGGKRKPRNRAEDGTL